MNHMKSYDNKPIKLKESHVTIKKIILHLQTKNFFFLTFDEKSDLTNYYLMEYMNVFSVLRMI